MTLVPTKILERLRENLAKGFGIEDSMAIGLSNDAARELFRRLGTLIGNPETTGINILNLRNFHYYTGHGSAQLIGVNRGELENIVVVDIVEKLKNPSLEYVGNIIKNLKDSYKKLKTTFVDKIDDIAHGTKTVK